MNHIYRVIFNKTLRVMQAVSELGHRFGRGRSTCTQDSATAAQKTAAWRSWLRLTPLCLALVFMLPGSAWANDTECTLDASTKIIKCDAPTDSKTTNAYNFSNLTAANPADHTTEENAYIFSKDSVIWSTHSGSDAGLIVNSGHWIGFEVGAGKKTDGTFTIQNINVGNSFLTDAGKDPAATEQHSGFTIGGENGNVDLSTIFLAQGNTVDAKHGEFKINSGLQVYASDDDGTDDTKAVIKGSIKVSTIYFTGGTRRQLDDTQAQYVEGSKPSLYLWTSSGHLAAKSYVGTADDDYSRYNYVYASRTNVSFVKLPPSLAVYSFGSTEPAAVTYKGDAPITSTIYVFANSDTAKTAPFTIEGSPKFEKGSVLKTASGATVVSKGDADFGDVFGDPDSQGWNAGNLEIASGHPTAAKLPSGTTSVAAGTSLTYDGSATPPGTLQLADSTATLKAAPPSGSTLDLSNKLQGSPGKLDVADGALVSATDLPNGGTTVNGGANLTYKNETAPTGSIVLATPDAKLTAEPGPNKTLNLGDKLAGQKGKLAVAPGSQVDATDLPQGGTEVGAGSGLTYQGTAAPTAPIQLTDNKSTLTVQPNDTNATIDLSDKVSGAGNVDVKSGSVTATALPSGTTTVEGGTGLTYTGTNPVTGNISLPDEKSKLTVTPGNGETLHLADKVSGDGSMDVTNGNVAADQLPKSTNVQGGKLDYNGADADQVSGVTVGQDATVALNKAVENLNLGNVKGAGNIDLNANQTSATLPDTANVNVNSGTNLDYTGTDGNKLDKVTLKNGGKLGIDQTIPDLDLSKVKGEDGTITLNANQTTAKLGTTNNVAVGDKATLTYTGDPDGINHAKGLQNSGTVVLDNQTDPHANAQWGDAINKIHGTGIGNSTIELKGDLISDTLSGNNTMKVGQGSKLQYTGTKAPEKGSLVLEDSESTLETTGDGLNLGDALDGQKGKLVVAGPNQTASSLPDGGTTVDQGSDLTYDSSKTPTGSIVLKDKDSTLNVNPGEGNNVNLGDKVSGAGKLAVETGTVAASKLPEGTTTVKGGSGLQYKGTETPTGNIQTEEGSTVTAGFDPEHPVNLGDKVQGAGKLAVEPGGKVNASNVPTGGADVGKGSGLTYDGTGTPGGDINLNDPTATVTAGAGDTPVDLGDKIKGTGKLKVADNGKVTASNLPEGGTDVGSGSGLTYDGTKNPTGDINLSSGSKLTVSPGAGNTIDLADKVKGDGSLDVANGAISASRLPPTTKVDGGKLDYNGSSADEVSGVTVGKDATVALNKAVENLDLGKVKGDGNIDLNADQSSATLPDSANVNVNKGKSLDYTGTDGDKLDKVTLKEGGNLAIDNTIENIDLSKVKGEDGKITLNADQETDKLGTTNNVSVGKNANLTYTGGPEGIKNAKGLENAGTVVLDNKAHPEDNTNWGDAIDKIHGTGIGDSAIALKGDLVSDKLSGNNTMKVLDGSKLTYSGTEAPKKGQLVLQDKDSTLKTTADGMDLGDALEGQKGSLELAGKNQKAASIPDGGATVDKGADLTFTGDKVPKAPIHLPDPTSTLKVKPADGKTLDLGDSLKGEQGKLEVEPGAKVKAESLPANTSLDQGADMKYTGDTPPTGNIDLSNKGSVTFTKTTPDDFSKFTMGPGSSLVLDAPSKNALDLSKIQGKGGSVVLNKDAKVVNLGMGHQNISVGPGANMTYNGDVDVIVKNDIHINNQGKLFFGGHGDLGAAMSHISGGDIAITEGADFTVYTLSSKTGAFSVEKGATVRVGGPGHQEPIFLKSMHLEGNVDFSKAGPVTLLDSGNEQLNPYPWFKNSFNFNPNRTTVVTHTSQLLFNPDQPNRTVGDYIIQGGELKYASTLPQGEAHTNAFDGLLLVTIGGKAEFSAKGQGSETAKLTRVEANFYDGWWPKHLVDASSGGNIGGSVDSTPSADKDKEGGASGTGSSDASGAGSSTTNSGNGAGSSTTNAGNGAASGSTPSDNNAASGSSSNEPAPTMMSLRAADPAATSTSSASAGNGDTASDNTGANEGAAGGTETDKPVAKELPTKPPVGDKPAPGRSQDKPCNPCFDQNQPEPSLAPGQLEKGGVLNVTLDNAYWVTHGFSQFHTLTTRNTAIVDYHNPEHDAKAVRVETLDGSFTLDMPLNTENFSLSGQFYAVKSGSDKAAASGAADNGTSGASTDNSASGASGAAAGNTAAGTESTQEAGNAASNNAASNNAGSTAAAAAKSVIQLVVPDYNPDDEAFSKNILVLKKTPLRVAVVPNNVSVVLQKTGREFMVGDSIYMYKIIHEPFKADKTYDNGDKTALNGYYNTVTFEDAEKDFANHTSYFLTIVEVASRNIGLSEPMRNEMQAGNELAYRISARLERMAPTYRTDLMDQRSKLWARADYHQGDLKQGASYRGFGVAFGLDHASAYGANSVLHMGLQGHVEKTHLVESSTQPLKLKQLNAGVSLYASYFNHDVYVGALAGYEFVAQNEPNFDVKTKMHAAKVSLETGVSFLTKGHFYILPEAQLQYTHFFANTVNGKHLGVGFVAKNKALKSLQGRLGLHVKKEHTLGAADIVWDVGMDYIHEFTAQQHFVGHRDLRLSTDVDYNYDLRDDQLQLSIGVDMKLGAHFGLGVGFEHRLDLDSTRTDQRVKAGLKWDF